MTIVTWGDFAAGRGSPVAAGAKSLELEMHEFEMLVAPLVWTEIESRNRFC
jgi:hypothetical protein